MTIETVNKLIARSFKVIGLVGDDRNISDSKTQEGLDLLNELLDSYFSTPYLIAYDSEVQFNMVVGQKSYEFSNETSADITSNKIAHLKGVNIINSNVSHYIDITEDFIDWDIRRVIDMQKRPTQCYLQNENFKSFIIFDVLPDLAYLTKVKAKFALNNVALNADLTAVPIYYTRFLKYALARELNSSYPGSIWDEKLEGRYEQNLKNVKSTADKDLLQRAGVGLIGVGPNRYYGINPY